MYDQDVIAPQQTTLFRRVPGRIALSLGLLIAAVAGLSPQLLAADAPSDVVLSKDTLTINNGTYLCRDDSLKSVARYALAGSFHSNLVVSPKFPCGGALQIQPANAPRLNPDATMVFHGGYLFFEGGKSVEQIKQIQFLSGMSEIRLEKPKDATAGVTLLVSDPENSVVRNQGAAVMVAGDEKHDKGDLFKTPAVLPGFSTALGAAEKLRFASGMAKYLKGAGGPAGSTSQSIIPWMTVGSFLQPGLAGPATYDPEKGVHCLSASEYDKKLQGTPDRNVWVEGLDLGENKTQVVNSLIFAPYYSSQIGAGSTLTITSGFLQFARRGPSMIGVAPQDRDYKSTGTINFGSAEGVIWTCFEPEWGPDVIGPLLAGSGGLTIAGSNTLVLHGASTYTGKTCISGGVLQVGDVFPTKAKLGDGDVEVAAGAALRIMPAVTNAIADTTTITLLHAGTALYGTMDLGAGVNETVKGLVLDGAAQLAGTYGSSTSPAAHKLDQYFSGSGVLTVTSQVTAK